MNDEACCSTWPMRIRVAPFLPWAKAVYEYRQRSLLKDDPYRAACRRADRGSFKRRTDFNSSNSRSLGRILVLLGGGDRNWRVIYTDGRPQARATIWC